MTTATFDTLKFARKLKEAGVSEQQAFAEAEAIKDAFSEALDTQVATKLDIADLKKEIYLLKWMIGAILAGIISLVIKAFFV